MDKLKAPSVLHRLTIDSIDTISETIGVYVVAYMGRIVYVGKSADSIHERLRGHLTRSLCESLGSWLQTMYADWGNIRLDVLVPPDDDDGSWIAEAEARLIQRFTPLFNVQLQP
jgi:excinuclease UvrABC nuclease subunit